MTLCELVPEGSGGLAKAVRRLIIALRSIGIDVRCIPLHTLSSLSLHKLLRNCQIIHVHGITLRTILGSLFLPLIRKRFIVTFHGWYLDEAKITVSYERVFLKKIIKLLGTLIIYCSLRILAHFGYVTAGSRDTAIRNRVKAVIIPNIIIPNEILLKARQCAESTGKKNNEFVIVAYLSMGGGKILSIPSVLKLASILSKQLNKTNKKVRILLFTSHIPEEIKKYLTLSDIVTYMGYREDFICYLKDADLLLLPYKFKELGLVALEAGVLGIPVAKFTDNPAEEELVEGVTGILARNEREMTEKILYYLTHQEELRRIGRAYREYIIKTRTNYPLIKWKFLIRSLVENRR